MNADIKTAIREYLAVADAVFRQQIRDGAMTLEEAKQDTIEADKWRELLASLEAENP
jgi:hypothetical protein